MAHNTLVRINLTQWSSQLAVMPAELYALDQACFKSINGDEGGVWSPTSAITIQGANGLLSNAPIEVGSSGSLKFSGTGFVTGTPAVPAGGFSLPGVVWSTTGVTITSPSLAGTAKTEGTNGFVFGDSAGTTPLLQVGGAVKGAAKLQIRDGEIEAVGSAGVNLFGRFNRGSGFTLASRLLVHSTAETDLTVYADTADVVILAARPIAPAGSSGKFIKLSRTLLAGGAVPAGTVIRVSRKPGTTWTTGGGYTWSVIDNGNSANACPIGPFGEGNFSVEFVFSGTEWILTSATPNSCVPN